MKQTQRKPSNLSQSLQQHLNAYAITASAAGVGMLALAKPAEAKIVYTPAHVTIGHGGAQHFYIDLNHDGVNDFAIGTNHNSCTSECVAALNAYPAFGVNEIGGKKGAHASSFYASALREGARIGPGGAFGTGGPLGCVMVGLFSLTSRRVWGDWDNVSNRYLALRFRINGKIHYGWARLNAEDHGHYIRATLTGYAYETVPNEPIVAGKTKGPDVIALEPDGLGALAVGSSRLHNSK
jgi:hypothetical protein